MSQLALVLICVGLIVLVVAFIANLHRLLNLLLHFSLPHTGLRGRGSGGEGIASGFAYERLTDLRPLHHRRSGGWVSEQQCNYVGPDSRRHRGNRLDSRTQPHLVHGSAGLLSEFPSIGEIFAYLWKGIKAPRQLRQRTEHKSSLQPISHADARSVSHVRAAR